MTFMTQIHATCVSLEGTGVLLIGPPGSGKSDLALRLIDGGATLIADDRVEIERRANGLIASAPRRIAGLLEVRGIGIARLTAAAESAVALALEMSAPEKIERLPPTLTWECLGIELPLIKLDPFAASACAKVRLAVRNVTQDIIVEP